MSRALGALCLVAAGLSVPAVLACGGCPRAGRSADEIESTADGAEQSVRSHEDPRRVLFVDDAFVLAPEDDAIAPGPLTADAVHAVIATQSVDLRRCYERALSEHPALRGQLVLELHVAPAGHVIDASVVEDSTGDGMLTNCFADHARRWHFPESARETTLRYPFELRPAVSAAPPADADAAR